MDPEAPWLRGVVERFYGSHRIGLEGLYASERPVLDRILPSARSVLDVGCAAGGLCDAMRALRPDVRYAGLDISPGLLRRARARLPGTPFLAGRAAALPFRDSAVDLVYCVSLLHVLPDFERAVAEFHRVAGRFAAFDARLTDGETIRDVRRSSIDVVFDETPPADADRVRLPYIVVRAREFLDLLLSLRPAPRRIEASGYLHPPSGMARCPLDEVGMVFFVVEKGPGDGPTEVRWAAPYAP